MRIQIPMKEIRTAEGKSNRKILMRAGDRRAARA